MGFFEPKPKKCTDYTPEKLSFWEWIYNKMIARRLSCEKGSLVFEQIHDCVEDETGELHFNNPVVRKLYKNYIEE